MLDELAMLFLYLVGGIAFAYIAAACVALFIAIIHDPVLIFIALLTASIIIIM